MSKPRGHSHYEYAQATEYDHIQIVVALIFISFFDRSLNGNLEVTRQTIGTQTPLLIDLLFLRLADLKALGLEVPFDFPVI